MLALYRLLKSADLSSVIETHYSREQITKHKSANTVHLSMRSTLIPPKGANKDAPAGEEDYCCLNIVILFLSDTQLISYGSSDTPSSFDYDYYTILEHL